MSKHTDYKILVTTGDYKYAGTDSDVAIVLIDVNGQRSGPHVLDKFWRDDFERGNTDDFTLKNVDPLDELDEIELIFNGSDWWYCEKVEVDHLQHGDKYIFPVHRWLKKTMTLKIACYDSDLPQYSKHQQQRREELEEKRRHYQYTENYPGLPVQVKDMPNEESFSDDFKWDLMKTKFKLISEKLWSCILGSRQKFTSVSDIENVFDELPSLEKPPDIANWTDDFYFGDRRLNGCNPKMIKLCTKIPDNFKVEHERVEELLEGSTLQTAIDQKRIFIVNLKILENIRTVRDTLLCAPLALFYHTTSGRLRPLAIQLYQSGQNNPVFYPSDDENLWLLVKIWYNNADASFHQSCVHLSCTHLIMEGISVCTNRNLSPSHPIYKLLAPHFLYIMAINTLGLKKLISPGGWVENTMTIGRDGMMQLMAKRHSEFRMGIDGDFKEDLKERGLLEDLLPNYYYRKDGLLLYEAIGKYVGKMVRLFYPTVDDIKNDFELQSWAQELVAPRGDGTVEVGGLGLKAVPGNGKFDNHEDLITFIRLIIFTCSCEHAAANFNQYDNYAFPPNYPAYLRGPPPKDKRPRTEADIVDILPSKAQMVDTMVITKILSTRSTQPLGEFETNYHHHPEVLDNVKEFRRDLREISQKIDDDMPNRRTDYSLLNPRTVPNSISI